MKTTQVENSELVTVEKSKIKAAYAIGDEWTSNYSKYERRAAHITKEWNKDYINN